MSSEVIKSQVWPSPNSRDDIPQENVEIYRQVDLLGLNSLILEDL